MPTIEKLHKEWRGKGLVVFGISNEEAEPVEGAREKLGLSFPTALDPEGRVRAHYGGTGIPFHVVIDRKGKVTAEALGTRHEEEFLGLLRRAGLK